MPVCAPLRKLPGRCRGQAQAAPVFRAVNAICAISISVDGETDMISPSIRWGESNAEGKSHGPYPVRPQYAARPEGAHPRVSVRAEDQHRVGSDPVADRTRAGIG